MAINSKKIDYLKDYYRGFAKIYFNQILDTIIDFGDLTHEQNLILDYGCGHNHLKKRLPQANIVGYDIIPQLSEINNFRYLKPQQIVLSGVLEHIPLSEIHNLLLDFIKMNPTVTLLVFLPTENFASKIMMYLARQPYAHDDHVSKYQDINQLIENYWQIQKRKYIFFKMAQITKYVPYPKK